MEGRKSISSGMGGLSLPQWMKNRMNEKLELDHTAFSPPSSDESFLYIKYPRGNAASATTSGVSDPAQTSSSSSDGSATTIDLSKHTDSCKNFILGHNVQAASMVPSANGGSATKQTKPVGVDDGFTGLGAACGTSIIRVANQMVGSGKIFHGFSRPATTASGLDAMSGSGDPGITTDSSANSTDDLNAALVAGFKPSMRRGSKSLPASPLSSPHVSPKSSRKFAPNRFFAGPSEAAANALTGSITLALLSKRDNLARSSSTITEEELQKKMNIPTIVEEVHVEPPPPVVKAKPSQLREMNFWSPTSM